jgi:hypothetical protein
MGEVQTRPVELHEMGSTYKDELMTDDILQVSQFFYLSRKTGDFSESVLL